MDGHPATSATLWTRSRTNLFLSYRDSAIRPSKYGELNYGDEDDDDEEDEAGIHGGGESRGLLSDESAIEMGLGRNSRRSGRADTVRAQTALPPRWVDMADKVDDIVERVKPKSTLSRTPSDFCPGWSSDRLSLQLTD